MLSSAFSQETDTLKEVEVKRDRLRQINKYKSVQTLNSQQLSTTNSLTVAEAVRHFTGVQLKDYGGIGGLKTINVRSLGSLHTSVFYNGFQLGNAQNGQVDLGKFSLENVQSVELANSEIGGELLPAEAFSLANNLYIQTKSPSQTGLKVSFKTGSFGLVNPSFTWNQRISGKLFSSINAELLSANGKYKFDYRTGNFDTTLTRNNGDLRALRIETGIYRSGSDSSGYSVQAYFYGSDRGLSGVILDNVYENRQRLSDNDFFIQANLRKKINPLYSFHLRAKFSGSFNRYRDPDWLGEPREINNWYAQTESYLSFSNQFSILPFWKVSLAADVKRSHMDAKIDFNPTGFPEPTRLAELIALASEFRIQRFTINPVLLSSFTQEKVKTGSAAYNKKAVNPAVNLSWQPFANQAFYIRSFYKNSFRLPTFNDLYYTSFGNVSLSPESSNQYNVGFSFQKAFTGKLDFAEWKADAYFNQVRDKIIAIPTKSLFLWSMVNLGKVNIRGIETSLRTQAKLSETTKLSAILNYTYQQAKDMTAGPYYNQSIPYAPKHSGSANLSLTFKRWNASYNYIYTGERYGLRTADSFSYMEPWYTHDVSLSRTFGLKKNSVRTIAELNNLFDLPYEVVRNYPMPGRNFRLAVVMNLNNNK